MQPYFRTSNFSETFLISVLQWSLKVPAKNARTQYSTISSLLLESQTERRYQSPNMHLDTMAEETICKPYLRIFQNTADQWQSGASSRGVLSIHIIFHLIILPILTFEWLWFHLQGTAGKEGLSRWQRTSTHKHLRQWVRLLVHKPTAKTIADSEEKGNSNQNTIHHQKNITIIPKSPSGTSKGIFLNSNFKSCKIQPFCLCPSQKAMFKPKHFSACI